MPSKYTVKKMMTIVQDNVRIKPLIPFTMSFSSRNSDTRKTRSKRANRSSRMSRSNRNDDVFTLPPVANNSVMTMSRTPRNTMTRSNQFHFHSEPFKNHRQPLTRSLKTISNAKIAVKMASKVSAVPQSAFVVWLGVAYTPMQIAFAMITAVMTKSISFSLLLSSSSGSSSSSISKAFMMMSIASSATATSRNACNARKADALNL
mmetsp:Transcript_5415/g.13123  ORF Transcript_5415/g.13123 Transcript_5415/m.13123 type:complete len:205 (-) Transcript_5415:1181-1795(-)